MKKQILIVTLLAALTGLCETKIGVVDMFMLVRNHRNYDTNKATVVQTEKDFTKKMDAMREAMEDLQKEGLQLAEQARNPMLAQSEKARLEKQLVSLQQKLMAQQQQMRAEMARAQQEIQALESRLLKVTTDDLRKYVDACAQAGGYSVILDKSATAFVAPEADITMEILKAMGVENPVKPGESESAKKGDANESK